MLKHQATRDQNNRKRSNGTAYSRPHNLSKIALLLIYKIACIVKEPAYFAGGFHYSSKKPASAIPLGWCEVRILEISTSASLAAWGSMDLIEAFHCLVQFLAILIIKLKTGRTLSGNHHAQETTGAVFLRVELLDRGFRVG